VTTDIRDESILELLLRRPFFLLVSIDAPLTTRWTRHKQRYIPRLY
jgi:dCMP deaminase